MLKTVAPESLTFRASICRSFRNLCFLLLCSLFNSPLTSTVRALLKGSIFYALSGSPNEGQWHGHSSRLHHHPRINNPPARRYKYAIHHSPSIRCSIEQQSPSPKRKLFFFRFNHFREVGNSPLTFPNFFCTCFSLRSFCPHCSYGIIHSLFVQIRRIRQQTSAPWRTCPLHHLNIAQQCKTMGIELVREAWLQRAGE